MISNFPKTKPRGNGKKPDPKVLAAKRLKGAATQKKDEPLPPARKPGWYLGVVIRATAACPNGWPPHYVPTTAHLYSGTYRPAHASRESQLAAGHESAKGTIPMAKTPNNPPPGWMK